MLLQQLRAVFTNHIRSFLKSYINNYAVFSIYMTYLYYYASSKYTF